MSHWLNAINSHLNNSFVEQQGGHSHVMSVLLRPFYDIVWVAQKSMVQQALMAEIREFRNSKGISADLNLLKDVIRIITHMGACSVDKRIVGVTTKSGLRRTRGKMLRSCLIIETFRVQEGL